MAAITYPTPATDYLVTPWTAPNGSKWIWVASKYWSPYTEPLDPDLVAIANAGNGAVLAATQSVFTDDMENLLNSSDVEPSPNSLVVRTASGGGRFESSIGNAVAGTSTSSGKGGWFESVTGVGSYSYSNSGDGVQGVSDSGRGVKGSSYSLSGVEGSSQTGTGGKFSSATGNSVFARATADSGEATIVSQMAVGQDTSTYLFEGRDEEGDWVFNVSGTGVVTCYSLVATTISVSGQSWSGATITGPQSFSSTTRPTSSGIGTPASNSLIKFDDVTQDVSWLLSWLPSTGTANTQGNSPETTRAYLQLNSGFASTSRVVTVAGGVNLGGGPWDNNGSGANMRMDVGRLSFVFDMQHNGLSNNEIRFIFGAVNATDLALGAAGFAVVITSNTTCKLQIWGSSGLVESSSLTIPSISSMSFRYLITYASGTLKLWQITYSEWGTVGRYSLVGTLTATVPATAAGKLLNVASVATGTPAFNTSLQIRSSQFFPRVITPLP